MNYKRKNKNGFGKPCCAMKNIYISKKIEREYETVHMHKIYVKKKLKTPPNMYLMNYGF
jgi:hypothetical protein